MDILKDSFHFRNNDLPEVMLAGVFEKYIHRYGVIPNIKPVIFTNNSSTSSLLKSIITLIAFLQLM